MPTSPSNFVDKLPPAEGEAKDGVHESRGVPSKFEYSGRYGSVTGAVWVRLHKPGSFGPEANLEISVERGTVRGYLAEKPGFRYVQATPGHPASLTGHMVLLHVYRFMLEAVDGEATGVSYRIWR